MNKIGLLRQMIAKSNYIVFFGGAGVSTESDIPDFRSESGLYHAKMQYRHTPEEMLGADFFNRHPETFYRYYKENILHLNAEPNDAHLALVELEKAGKLKAIVTQNIDGLHQKAGSKVVVELHGSVYKNYCIKCGRKHNVDYVEQSLGIPICHICESIVRPDVVLYGEALNEIVVKQAINHIENADMLIVGGTSLVVYPAVSLIGHFKGINLVLINKSSTGLDGQADLVINESIGKVLKQAVDNL
jgi:NAD-dependent deacetylase